METLKVAIVGGGAGGFFNAIRCAELAKSKNKKAIITIYEASETVLKKVRISGGGRCNVTHHLFDPKLLVLNYPRGKKELLSAFYSFQTKDTVNWFAERGVKLKYEDDGRMFPVSDNSETIINCFLDECKKYGVRLQTKNSVKSIKVQNDKFLLSFKSSEATEADRVLIATGSSTIGYDLAKGLGHKITELAPSLFTFKIKDELIDGLSGISFINSKLTLKIENEKAFKQTGPLLITHWGLSGPALLKLSAWAARPMQKANYKAKIIINWLGLESLLEVEDLINKLKSENLKSFISNTTPKGLTKRFWHQLLIKSEVKLDKPWNELSKKEYNKLINNLFCCELSVNGKSRFKEEFVECGGVDLKQVDFKTMQSKLVKGLYFSGEILDIDGITGGFNFQNAWTTAWIAANHMITEEA